MNKLILIIFVSLVTANFAQAADQYAIYYGFNLCEVGAVKDYAMPRACRGWAIENSENNAFSIALNICGGFALGQSDKISNCFLRASQLINDQEVKDHAGFCVNKNSNYADREQCLKDLFFRKNNQVAKGMSVQFSGATSR